MKIYEIGIDIIDIQAELEREDITPDERGDLFTELVEDMSRASNKVEQYIRVLKNNNRLEEAIGEEIALLQKRKKSVQANTEFLHGAVKWYMDNTGMKKANFGIFRARLQKAGRNPVILDMPAESLPEQYQRIKREANLTALYETLSTGEVLEFAHLGEPKESLIIS